MWRYFEMLPVKDEKNIVSLGEGMTRFRRLNKLASHFNLSSFASQTSLPAELKAFSIPCKFSGGLVPIVLP
jgi:hypothetical protein